MIINNYYYYHYSDDVPPGMPLSCSPAMPPVMPPYRALPPCPLPCPPVVPSLLPCPRRAFPVVRSCRPLPLPCPCRTFPVVHSFVRSSRARSLRNEIHWSALSCQTAVPVLTFQLCFSAFPRGPYRCGARGLTQGVIERIRKV